MKRFKDRSIRTKNSFAIAVIIFITLIVSMIGIGFLYYKTLLTNLSHEAESIAAIVAQNSVVAIAFDDQEEGEKILQSLTSIPSVISAQILDNENRVFAYFSTTQARSPDSLRSSTTGTIHGGNYILHARAIRHQGEDYGTVRLVVSTSLLNAHFTRVVIYSFLIILAASFLAFFAGDRLSAIYTRPIEDLANTVSRISAGGDYTLQVNKSSDDEVGILTDNFNTMMRQILMRDQEIRNAAMQLEKRVEERTHELALNNAELQREIATRRQVEVAMEASEEKFRSIIEKSTNLFYTHTPDHLITYLSPQVRDILGYEPEEAMVGWIHLTTDNPVNQEGNSITERAIKTGTVQPPYELELRHKSGKVVWVEVHEAPVVENGVTTSIVGALTDITQRKTYEEELRQATRKAQESERLKSAFLANMSHEIRTPMNAILGFSQLLQDDDLDAASRKKFADIITNRGNDLLTLINDIVDISKIEAGLLAINHETCPVNAILEETVMLFMNDPKRIQKDLRLLVDRPLDDAAATILTDTIRLRQILVNLVHNAIKFTEQGTIEIGYNLVKEETDAFLQFYVRDTGIGLNEQDLLIIFERFRQAEHASGFGTEGTGLGLSICRALVDLLGGKIWVSSSPMEGATFFFTLPYLPTVQPPSQKVDGIPTPQAGPDKTHTVLIVDDIEHNAELLDILLRDRVNTVIASGGREAIALCKSRSDIDLVLLDLKMPGMDGFSTLAGIRKIRPGLPVIVQTAYAQKGDRERFLQAGFDNYLEKPILKEKLVRILATYFST